jgi:hypothetical protein
VNRDQAEILDDIMMESLRLQDVSLAVAKDLADIHTIAMEYFERSAKHREIIAEAKQQALVDGVEQAYRLAANKMLSYWPDAFGYGAAVEELRAALLGESK